MNYMGKAIFIGLCYMGVQIDEIDKNKNIVYISVPEESVDYNQTSALKTPQDLARFIKDQIFETTFNIKYKIRNENWTEGIKMAKRLTSRFIRMTAIVVDMQT